MHKMDLVVFSAVTLLASAQACQALSIVREGKPQASIVVAKSAMAGEKADESARKVATAAADVRDYIRKISGAELPIVSDEQPPAGAMILVGPSRLTASMNLDIPSGLTPARREEGFIIACKDNRLVLAGNDAGPYHGTEYATYELLERLGVRWFMPGEFGEIVPATKNIDVPAMSIRQKPDFIQRNWWLHASGNMPSLERRWKIRNRMNPDDMFAAPGDSSIRDYMAAKDLVKTEPDLFARNQDGSINPYLPNLSNPKAVQITADRIKERFRRRPGANCVGIAPDDGIPRDFTSDTVKRNQGFADVGGREGVPAEFSATEEWIEFVNAVTREVKKDFPDRVISTNGYANRNVPPQGVKIDPNVAIMFAAIWSDTLHAYNDPKSWHMGRQGQMLRQWCSLCDKVWLYNYTETMLVSCVTPVPTTRKLARDLPLMHKWGVIGFNDEARNQWMEAGITTHYIRARLEWDAHADVKAILSDFFTKWYGPAARPAQAFWDALEDAIESTPMLGHEDRILPYVYTPQLMAKLQAAIQEAEKLAGGERFKLHVRIDRLIYEHLKCYMAMWKAEFTGDFAEAAKQADAMMGFRKQLMEINPFLARDEEKTYEAAVSYWGATARAKYYRKLADLTSGKTGDLVAMLPESVAFQVDPRDEGRFAGWYQPAWDAAAWKPVSVTKPFYAQGYMSKEGYPYVGAMWYRTDVDVPAKFAGRKVMLLAPVVETEGWLWVNGQYIGHRPYHEAYERPNDMDMDITAAVKPGQKNTIVFRIATGLSPAQAAGGLCARVFLYSPK